MQHLDLSKKTPFMNKVDVNLDVLDKGTMMPEGVNYVT